MNWIAELSESKLDSADLELLRPHLDAVKATDDAVEAWCLLTGAMASEPLSFHAYHALWQTLFADWNAAKQGPAPMWSPGPDVIERANLTRWMRDLNLESYEQLHRWSVDNRDEFWHRVIEELDIPFELPSSTISDQRRGPTKTRWLPDAQLNIARSCFLAADDEPAIIYGGLGEPVRRWSFATLRHETLRVARALRVAGHQPGDAIAVVLPMTAESVAIYLGIVAAGCIVVSIADSFAAPQIASRLQIADAKAVFTYDYLERAGKRMELYSRVVQSGPTPAIVLPASRGGAMAADLRPQDLAWQSFLDAGDAAGQPPDFHVANANAPINILFSSGTTGEPKAIPWDHTTPIKCAADGMLHHDIHPGDVVAWPTNLGWMMGPWLVFATLMNRGTIAIYEDAPMGEGFGQFVQDSGVTMLGVVPTIVSAWRQSGCMASFDWSHIRVFSSTGEASNPDNMFYLSSLAGFRPVIEYCGGTEIGGGYITSTIVQPNAPAIFTTPALGLDITIIDDSGKRTDEGELFLVPPSIGLSSTLLNRNHDLTYYDGVPSDSVGRQLRRHGDHFRRLPSGYYAAGGRVDDTMNLGGIKVSSTEIEKVLNELSGITETAAVAVPAEEGGPDELVIFVVLGEQSDLNTQEGRDLQAAMNRQIREQLNPLFKIHRAMVVKSLPRTASNKAMRRKLRDQLLSEDKQE